ncbi:MAG: RIP metalloprotease RseP [Bryobacteraceae bacterium]
MAFLGPFFWVVILLGIMILVHEAGHFWAALSVGIRVETFSIGFGPRLFGFRRGSTDFRISAIPFGGYVRMLGDQPGDEHAASPDSFQSKARWQRAIVIIAGPFMNVLLAIALVTGLYMYGFPKEAPSPDAVISSVAPGSAAAMAGLQPGDRIVQLGDKRNPNWQDVTTEETLNANHSLPVSVKRKGQDLRLTVTPRMDPKDGVGVAGWRGDVQVNEVAKGSPAEAAGLRAGDLFINVNGQPVESVLTVQQTITRSGGKPVELELMRNNQLQKLTITPVASNSPKLPWRIGITFRLPIQIVKLPFAEALGESLRFNRQNATMIFEVLRSIVVHRVSPKALAGPIGIAQMSNEAAQEGPSSFIALMAIVSLNLAIFNLLPIPILDGGTLLLLLIEMLLQREVSLQVKETVFKLGFVFLMMVVVFVIYNDISRILTRG